MKCWCYLFLLLCILGMGVSVFAAPIRLLRVPGGGIQPQAVVDAKGVLHVIYFKSDAAGGDLFYTRRAPDDTAFAQAIQVNDVPNSAIAIGFIRGAHMALGKNGRVHVAWMASPKSNRDSHDQLPMYYARLNDRATAFEPQRNVIAHAYGLDGGGSVAADALGHVYVTWHAGQTEAERRVWVARSEDEGKTFSSEYAISDSTTGVCACCGMRAFADTGGKVYVMYRAATEKVHRDMYVLMSDNFGKTFSSRKLDTWEIEGCPMSASVLTSGASGVVAGWETSGLVFYGRLNGDRVKIIGAPGETKPRKHPSLASHAKGEVLMAWTEGTGWNRGGAVAWQVFDRFGQPTDVAGHVEGLPVWSLVSAVVLPDGFAVIY